ncbi:hypothetical protein [Marinobacter lutaoensis]|uniref:Uncharacterized protein n=1 Tax=Marinobacter lutaoensis TaxID=135739 RepID=A0A1V2DNG8_9GAMM|nr:hypothetical protein [Marinobacter lutaoensis]NVD35736.1 hypothetical protein [Marinobacter lutaoensis]ONF42194.1 hypothetical protein BTO32_16635 [Marinobacter lutaoensis]
MHALRSFLAYLALFAAVLAFWPGMALAGALAVGLAVLLGWRDMRRVPRVVFSVAGLALVFALGRDAALVSEAAGNMTRLAGLVLSVMLLSSVLGRSRDLQRISASLFGGRPGSRYLSLAFGTALVSIPLNFGAVAVVGSLVSERLRRDGDSAATRNATRAVLRGFGASPTFSPLSISVVLTLTLLPGLSSLQLLSLAIPFAILMVFAGLVWREPETEPESAPGAETAGLASWLRFGGLVLAICAGVFLLSHAYPISYAHAVTLSCLAVVLGSRLWAWSRGHNPPLVSMANVSNELAIVGGSAFIGSVISGAVLGQIQGGLVLPDGLWPVLAAAVPWVYFVAGLGGINPIVAGTLLGGILGSLWPESALIGLGIAMVTGWGITAFGTPFAANALIMERLTGYRAVDASFRWSLGLSLFGLTLASLLAAGLTAWLA